MGTLPNVMRPLLIALADELGISQNALASRGLPACEEAANLEVAEVGRDGREHLLVEPAATAWRTLKAAALEDGISLFIVSAFRSIERQADIVRRKLAEGRCIDDILAVCAPPGFSEHHSGRAVDVSTPGVPSLEIEFEQTPAFVWLDGRAREFNFYLSYPRGNTHGYQYEPWHWCFHDAQPIALREPDKFG